jgi:hypothetical protein
MSKTMTRTTVGLIYYIARMTPTSIISWTTMAPRAVGQEREGAARVPTAVFAADEIGHGHEHKQMGITLFVSKRGESLNNSAMLQLSVDSC